jgi:hypothetical protein
MGKKTDKDQNKHNGVDKYTNTHKHNHKPKDTCRIAKGYQDMNNSNDTGNDNDNDSDKGTDYGLCFDLSSLSTVDQAVIAMAWTAQQRRESGHIVVSIEYCRYGEEACLCYVCVTGAMFTASPSQSLLTDRTTPRPLPRS